ncbi:uncharacterized protein [Dermacentor albipictus]|uniref:uncharacterized protein n=1 Tax=Dermacentor albipictus TaxID=60249 RepID=UPI0038FD3B6E
MVRERALACTCLVSFVILTHAFIHQMRVSNRQSCNCQFRNGTYPRGAFAWEREPQCAGPCCGHVASFSLKKKKRRPEHRTNDREVPLTLPADAPMEQPASNRDVFRNARPASKNRPRHLQVVTGEAPNKPSTATQQRPATLSSSPPPVREILLVLTPPAPANPTESNRPATIPPADHQFQLQRSRLEETPQDERLCIQLWALWAALTFPLIFSMWLFLVPFLVNSNTTLLPAEPPFGGGSMPVTMPVTMPATIPAACLKPLTIPAVIEPIRVNTNPSLGPSTQSPRPFFCLFNNTAVDFSRNYSTTGTKFDFTFETLPFDLCHYVIYWSVGIDNGNITSRLPSFDQRHGIHQLRNIVDNLGYSNVKILLALGGYPEDGPHFSKLGQDPVTLNRLTANVVDAMRTFRLDGVAVHWVDPGASCRGPDDQGAVAVLLRMLRQVFDNNGMAQALVTAMLNGSDSVERLMYTSKDVVNYFLLTDHRHYPNASSSSPELCSTFTDNIVLTLRHFVNSVRGLRPEKICVAEPTATLAYDGYLDKTTDTFIQSQAGKSRWAPIYEACGKTRFCRKEGDSQSCVVHYANWAVRPNLLKIYNATMYLNALASTLLDRFKKRSHPPTNDEPCTFATFIEYDNYAGQCGSGYSPHLLLRQLYFGTLGRNIHNGSIQDAAPNC